MNFDIFEQWLCTFILPKRQKQVLRVMKNIQEKPIQSFIEGIAAMEPFQQSEDASTDGALLLGLLLGITIYHSFEKEKAAIEEIFQNYLDRHCGDPLKDLMERYFKKENK